jgi:hypothetical protein
MAALKIHDLTFTQFARAMTPTGGIGLTNPLDVPHSTAQWLASLWDSADKRVTISIRWQDTPLKDELPPAALTYHFDDLSLQASALALGLGGGVHADLRKVAELMATRNAWFSAIEHHCRQSADLLVNDVAQDYVRLSCNWLQHPWVQGSVRRYKLEQAREKAVLAHNTTSAPEMSSNPLWPSTPVIYGRCDPLTPQQEAQHQAKIDGIDYWTKQFEFEHTSWSSAFEMYAWDAQCDMDVAHRKITGLQEIIEKQQVLVRGFERIIKLNKRRETELSGTDKSGRPPKSAERQEVALKFTARWVQSLMDVLQVSSCAQLEATIFGSSQRNWSRWLSAQAVPTSKSFAILQASRITCGRYEGQPLQAVETTPASADMQKLIRLTGVAPKQSALA